MMRKDVVIFVAIFLAILLILALLSWLGYDRWSDTVL